MRFKSTAYTQYVSILNRIATQPLDVRCIFEIASNYITVGLPRSKGNHRLDRKSIFFSLSLPDWKTKIIMT
jgi:hypothetical protein